MLFSVFCCEMACECILFSAFCFEIRQWNLDMKIENNSEMLFQQIRFVKYSF